MNNGKLSPITVTGLTPGKKYTCRVTATNKWGNRTAVPLVNGRILARVIPRGRLQVIRGGGHLFLLERPAEVAGLVARFLDSGGVA